MERVRSVELASRMGERVTVAGWLHSVRRLGAVNFVVVRDGWGLVQAVAVERALAELGDAGPESIVEVEGTVIGEPQVELHGVTFRVLEPSAGELPVQLGKKQLNVPLAGLLEHAVIANRHPSR